MANAKKCDMCGEFYILASEKIPDSNGTFAYSNVIQDSNFLKEKKENTIYEK